MANPTTYQFDLPASRRPPTSRLEEYRYPGVEKYWPICTGKRSVDPILGIVAIVVHATAGASSEGAASVMKNVQKPASFHWLIPDEDEPQHGHFVWACVPEALAAWHVRKQCFHLNVNGGAKNVNQWSLGIEVVNMQNDDTFSDWQLEAAALIVRYCWAKYPNLTTVVSHAKLDPTRRSDPGSLFDWVGFRDRVFTTDTMEIPPLVAQATRLSRVNRRTPPGCCG